MIGGGNIEGHFEASSGEGRFATICHGHDAMRLVLQPGRRRLLPRPRQALWLGLRLGLRCGIYLGPFLVLLLWWLDITWTTSILTPTGRYDVIGSIQVAFLSISADTVKCIGSVIITTFPHGSKQRANVIGERFPRVRRYDFASRKHDGGHTQRDTLRDLSVISRVGSPMHAHKRKTSDNLRWTAMSIASLRNTARSRGAAIACSRPPCICLP